MRFGLRILQLKKSFGVRTTGKIKRKIRKAVNPFYGKKGLGIINNPKRSIKNRIYRKTTFGISDIFKWILN